MNQAMNQAFNLQLDIKPTMTQPKRPTPVKGDKPVKDSDFRKELENATTSKQPANKAEDGKPEVQKPEVQKPEMQKPDTESGNGSMQQEDTIDLQNVAVMMAAAMMPAIVMPEETVQVMPEETAQIVIDPTLTPVITEQQTQPQDNTQIAPLMIQEKTEEVPMEQQVKPVEVETKQQTVTVEQQVKPEHKTAFEQVVVAAKQGQEENPVVVTEASAAVQVERPLFEKVEATPIQVAQQPVRADQPEFPQHLAARIDSAAMQGQNTIEVQLEPYELGKITIRLTVTDEGTHLSMHSANDRTLRLLTEHAANIGAIVENNQHKPVSVSVEQEQSQYTQQEHHGNGGQQQQQQQQRHQDHPQNDDFIQQLRLGLAGRT